MVDEDQLVHVIREHNLPFKLWEINRARKYAIHYRNRELWHKNPVSTHAFDYFYELFTTGVHPTLHAGVADIVNDFLSKNKKAAKQIRKPALPEVKETREIPF